MRQRLRAGITDRIAPLLSGIVAQGVREGVFAADHPEQTGRVLTSLVQDLNDRLAELFFALESPAATTDMVEVERTATANTPPRFDSSTP